MVWYGVAYNNVILCLCLCFTYLFVENRLEFISNFVGLWKLNLLYLLRIEPTNPSKSASQLGIHKSVCAPAHNPQTELFLYGLYKMISNSKYDLKRGFSSLSLSLFHSLPFFLHACVWVWKTHINRSLSCSGVFCLRVCFYFSFHSFYSIFLNESPLIAIPKTLSAKKNAFPHFPFTWEFSNLI